MIPAEVMAKAAADRNGSHWHFWSEAMKQDAIADMRAALRALAEMEPSENLREVATASLGKTPIKDCEEEALRAWRLLNLAAAAEGDSQ